MVKEPNNIAFWKFTLKNQENVNAFLTRGSKQQKGTIKEVLKYLKRFDPDYFESINGETILREIK